MADRLGNAIQTEIHNRIAGELVRAMWKPPMEAGGTPSDVMVVLESVAVGIILLCVRPEDHDKATDLLAQAIKKRLAADRLSQTPIQGRA